MNRLSQVGVLILAATALPLAAQADSTFTTGSGTPITASAHLDFTIVIPKILYVRVGDGTANASNSTIDNIVYTVPAASVGTGTAVTGVGGDLSAGQVTAQVIGNNGTITFGSMTTGPLNDGASDTISYTQINTVAAANGTVPTLAHPTLADGATTNETLTPNSGTKVTNQAAKWTFTYLNAAIVPQGTYGGVNTQGGRVTYTASMP